MSPSPHHDGSYAWPPIVKGVTPVTATLGNLITYTILLPQPPITATVYNAVVTDSLIHT